ncbi:MAG: hypothetical protein Q8O67_11280 [Deltaproteobacteria bacterium]|nr:hypothetical protein [Deltaproteobacteria bacterium]
MGFFTSTSTRTFHTVDSPRVARRVIDSMTVRDGAPNGLPPGVLATRSRPGEFLAASPVAAFQSTFDVRPDGRGGSYVSESKTAFSPFPGMAVVADKIHDVATNPQSAYWKARSRT